MNSTELQQWEIAYLAVALLFALATPIVGQRLQSGKSPGVGTRAAVAVVAGAFWPLIVLGLAQLWVVHEAATQWGARPRHASSAEIRELVGVR